MQSPIWKKIVDTAMRLAITKLTIGATKGIVRFAQPWQASLFEERHHAVDSCIWASWRSCRFARLG